MAIFGIGKKNDDTDSKSKELKAPDFLVRLNGAMQYYFIRYMAFDAKTRNGIYKKLASYIDTGFALPEAINLIYEDVSKDGRKPNEPAAYVMNIVRHKISNGEGFGQAIEDWVPGIDATMLVAGAATDLSQALRDCVNIFEKKKAINGAIKAGIMGPISLLFTVIGFFLVYAYKIIPPFNDLFPIQKWKGLPATIAKVSLFFSGNLVFILAGMVGVIVLIMWSMPNWTGKLRVYFDKYPPWSLYRIYSGAGFMLVYAGMVKAGIKPTEILKILGNTGSKWMKERMNGTKRYIENGKNIGEALMATKLQFPDEKTVRDMRAYARMSNFENNLRDVANEWINTAEENVKASSKTINYVMMMIMALVIGAITVSSTQLQSQITAAIMQDAH